MNERVFRRDMRRHIRPSFKSLGERLSNAGSAIQDLVISTIFRRTGLISVMIWLERERGKVASYVAAGRKLLSQR